MADTLIEKCKHESWGGFMGRRVRCRFKASTPAGYCKFHDPELLKAKSDAKDEQWEKESVERRRVRLIAQKEREAIGVVKRIAAGVEDPTETARAFIRELDIVIKGEEK